MPRGDISKRPSAAHLWCMLFCTRVRHLAFLNENVHLFFAHLCSPRQPWHGVMILFYNFFFQIWLLFLYRVSTVIFIGSTARLVQPESWYLPWSVWTLFGIFFIYLHWLFRDKKEHKYCYLVLVQRRTAIYKQNFFLLLKKHRRETRGGGWEITTVLLAWATWFKYLSVLLQSLNTTSIINPQVYIHLVFIVYFF
jgi:hypothetical protein